MASPYRDPFHSPLNSPGNYDQYHDNDDPAMKPRQFGDVSSPALSMSEAGTPRPTPTRHSFRSSVGLIPTPGAVSKRHPTFEPIPLRFWVVVLGCALLTIIGVGLEVALGISNRNNGFHIPQKKEGVFSFASTQSLTSFIPSLLIGPIAIMIHSFDWAIRMWNPYLILSRGNASADETLLIDYIGDSRVFITYNAMRFRHKFVIVSGITALATVLLQPLAGAVLSVRQLPQSSVSTVQSIRDIGLNPNVNDLAAFAASAGYAESSVYNNLDDPPFVCDGWATAQFEFPTDNFLDGSMAVNTTGILTQVTCAIPNEFAVNSTIATNWTVTATSAEGCTVNTNFNPSDSAQQFGVDNVPNCGSNSTDPTFQPVFFWFWRRQPNAGAAVFCETTIQLYDVTAFASLDNGTITSVNQRDNYPEANNVSSSPLNGVPYNGLIFNRSTDTNVQARATSIRSGIPYAIFLLAQRSPGGLDFAFRNPEAFANYTEHVYTQHLSSATISNYFVPSNETVNSVLTQLIERLFVEPLPTHALAAICMLTSAILFTIHFLHYRERRSIYLAHPPGCIGSAVALTSHSGFGDLLLPYDDISTFSRALAPLRFALDRRTGAIVVDDSVVSFVEDSSKLEARDETMMTLMGKGPQYHRGDSLGGEAPRETQ